MEGETYPGRKPHWIMGKHAVSDGVSRVTKWLWAFVFQGNGIENPDRAVGETDTYKSRKKNATQTWLLILSLGKVWYANHEQKMDCMGKTIENCLKRPADTSLRDRSLTSDYNNKSVVLYRLSYLVLCWSDDSRLRTISLLVKWLPVGTHNLYTQLWKP